MGKNARIRKLRRQARREWQANPIKGAWAQKYQKKHPDSLLVSSAGTEKMSEVIEDFAQPLLEGVDSETEMHKALGFAIIAWNYSLAQGAGTELEPKLQALLRDPVLREVFDRLVARKQDLYPDNQRVVLDYQLFTRAGKFQFNVISTLPPNAGIW